MSEREAGALTPAMLSDTPVGGPGGFAACDSCNRGLTDGDREHDPDDAEADTVYAYATKPRDADAWALRWVSCEDCGPPGLADADHPGDRDPDEITAKAALTYDGRIDAFALTDPELAADEQAAAEDGDER